MKSFWEGHPETERYLAEVRRTILDRASTDDPDVRSAIEQMLEASGKMLRPGFAYLAASFGSPNDERMPRIGAAIEMLHMATLVHDDIIDGATLRRGVATLHARRGARVAVLVGDWLFAACFSLIADLTRTESARSLSQIVARICGSEISQSADRFVVNTSVRRYLRRIAGKTAALFALSFHVGAEDSGASAVVTSTLRRLGYCLGMGFQIIDDILDFAQAGKFTGKPTGSDLSQGIYTLPAILALQKDDGRLARALSRHPRGRVGISRVGRLIEELGGIQKARALAEKYTRRALGEIERLPRTDAALTLREITNRLLVRTY
jgi:heptaprenyl diphosphate synthase